MKRGPIRLFYSDEYVGDAVESGIRHAFDVSKARRIRDALVASGSARPGDFVAPEPLGDRELLLVHTPSYLDEIRRPDRLARLLLLDPDRFTDGRLLRPFLAAAGGTVAAARVAVREEAIGVNLGGGFHHAQADRAEGFCAIADVAIAVRALRREGRARAALIVDLDLHHGNGNAEIFSNDETVFTFSIHSTNWCWIDKRNNRDVELPAGTGDEAYLDALRANLPEILDRFRPDFVVYVAGSDPFAGDALGDFRLSEKGLLERDRVVTDEIRGRALPMAVVMGGGYGEYSWRIHFNYFRWLLD